MKSLLSATERRRAAVLLAVLRRDLAALLGLLAKRDGETRPATKPLHERRTR